MQRITQLWKSGVRGKLLVGCGGLLILLFACVIITAAIPSPSTTPKATITPTPVVAKTATTALKPTEAPRPTNTPQPLPTPISTYAMTRWGGVRGDGGVTSQERDGWRIYYLDYMQKNWACCVKDMRTLLLPALVAVVLDGELATRPQEARQSIANANLELGECLEMVKFEQANGREIDVWDNTKCSKISLATSTEPSIKTIGTLYVSAGGDGVYIRSQPDREARVKVWPDGTAMGLIEKAPSGWAKVQAPDGYVGYIPLEYLADKIPPTRTPAPTQPPAPPPSASTVGGLPVTVNGWTWSVYQVKKEKAVYFYQDSAVAEGMFYILFLRITNGRSGTSYPEKDLDFYLMDASGKRYTTSRFEYYAQWQYGGKGDSFDEFQPGQTGEIILLYDVPSGTTGLRLVGTRDGQGAISIP